MALPHILGGRKERQEVLYENIGHKKSQRDTSTFRSETNDLLTRRSYKFLFLAFFTLNVHAIGNNKGRAPRSKQHFDPCYFRHLSENNVVQQSSEPVLGQRSYHRIC